MKWWLCISFLLNILLLIMLAYLKKDRDSFMKMYYNLASFVLKARREGKLWNYQQEDWPQSLLSVVSLEIVLQFWSEVYKKSALKQDTNTAHKL